MLKYRDSNRDVIKLIGSVHVAVKLVHKLVRNGLSPKVRL
jgi:hypothetical protein